MKPRTQLFILHTYIHSFIWPPWEVLHLYSTVLYVLRVVVVAEAALLPA